MQSTPAGVKQWKELRTALAPGFRKVRECRADMSNTRDLPDSRRLNLLPWSAQSYLEQNWAGSIVAEVDKMTERLIGYASSGQDVKLLQEMIVSIGPSWCRHLWRQEHDG